MLTCSRKSHDIGDIGHENAAFELQLGVLIPHFWSGGLGFVLLVLGLVGYDLLATQQYALKQIDLILDHVSIKTYP